MLTNTSNKAGPYACNGVTTQYSFSFPVSVTNGTDIKVYYTNADGTTTLLTSGYRVVLNNVLDLTAGGYVEYPYPSGTNPTTGKITILRVLPVTQLRDWRNSGTVNWNTVEAAMDKLTMIIQQYEEIIRRAMVADVTESAGVFQFPTPAAGKAILWNAEGDGFVNQDLEPSANNFNTTIISNVASGTPPIQVASTDECLNLRSATASKAYAVKETGSEELDLYFKKINIGNWNMDSTANVSIAHGITDFTKIVSVSVVIIPDLPSVHYPLTYADSGNIAGYFDITNIAIVLYRVSGRFFDSADFDTATYNRGYILIGYTS